MRFRAGEVCRGFTLIEILIYMGLMAALITVLTNVFVTVLETQLESSSVSVVEIDGRYVLSRLIYDIHRATSITTPAVAGQTSPGLTLNIGGPNHTYTVTDGVLYLDGSSRLTSIDTSVSNLSFTRVGNSTDNDTLRISFTLTSLAQSQNYNSTVSLRTN